MGNDRRILCCHSRCEQQDAPQRGPHAAIPKMDFIYSKTACGRGGGPVAFCSSSVSVFYPIRASYLTARKRGHRRRRPPR
jgi:hypothetical protein